MFEWWWEFSTGFSGEECKVQRGWESSLRAHRRHTARDWPVWTDAQIRYLNLIYVSAHKDTPFLDKKMHLDVFLLSKYILAFVILIIGFNIYSLCHWAFYFIFFSINWGSKFNAPLASFQLWSLNCFCRLTLFPQQRLLLQVFPSFMVFHLPFCVLHDTCLSVGDNDMSCFVCVCVCVCVFKFGGCAKEHVSCSVVSHMEFSRQRQGVDSHSFLQGSSSPRDQTRAFCIAGRFFTIWATREAKPVKPKENQSWIFIGRTDAETEAPIVWPPDVKSWFIGKYPDAGKDGRQEEKGATEDQMVGWNHQLNGHEFEQAPGDSEE